MITRERGREGDRAGGEVRNARMPGFLERARSHTCRTACERERRQRQKMTMPQMAKMSCGRGRRRSAEEMTVNNSQQRCDELRPREPPSDAPCPPTQGWNHFSPARKDELLADNKSVLSPPLPPRPPPPKMSTTDITTSPAAPSMPWAQTPVRKNMPTKAAPSNQWGHHGAT